MPSSLSSLLRESAIRNAGRPAIAHEQRVTTYAQLAENVEHLSGHLAALGLSGQRVGLLLPNLPVLPLALYGAWRARCGVLLLNPLNSPRETAEYIGDASVGAVLTVAALRDRLPAGTRVLLADELPEILRVSDGDPGVALRLSDAPPPPGEPERGDAEAVVLYTAAVDGRARGAVLSHRNLIANLTSTVEAMRIDRDDRVVAALPLIHAFGLTVSLNATLASGACVLPVERFHPVRILDLLEERRATVFAGVPSMFISMLDVAERRGVPDHALRVTLCGGAPLPAGVTARWEERFGLPLRQGYGLTEAGPVCLFNRVDRPNHPDTLGVPLPGVEVTIRGPDGAELPVGEVGEICVRGNNVFLGYLRDDAATASAFFGPWLRTGDLGSASEDGTVRFRGILKPMFTRNGYNVYPREVERALEADPRVARATVLALPDPLRENEIVLTVRPEPAATLTEDDVGELCRDRLAAYKQPSRIVIEREPDVLAADRSGPLS